MEEAAMRELGSPFGAEAFERWREYEAGESAEARFVRLCDGLQLGLRLLAYRRSGRRGLGDFDVGLRELDCSEFAALAELHVALLHELGELPA
jgi:5'-deoxynucleotidase YfbR-like HD superfamily hydrolase